MFLIVGDNVNDEDDGDDNDDVGDQDGDGDQDAVDATIVNKKKRAKPAPIEDPEHQAFFGKCFA